MMAPSATPLVPMVGPSRRTTGPVVESSRPSIAFARVAENVPCTTPLRVVLRSMLSILRRKNCKLCFFCRYLVEKTCASRKRYSDFQTCCRYYDERTANYASSVVITSKKLALQGNATQIFKRVVEHYDERTANSASSVVITSKFARFKETLP